MSGSRCAAGAAVTALTAALALGSAPAAPAGLPSRTLQEDAPDQPCAVCEAPCLKPWSVPDRWDDSGVPGMPDWAGNGRYDAEPFTDLDRNGYWDFSEPFKDLNGDGAYSQEYYHPLLTGYLPSRDLGLPVILKPGPPGSAPVPSHYYVVDVDPNGGSDPTCSRYEWLIANCGTGIFGSGSRFALRTGNLVGPTVRGVEALVARDPGARWDAATQSVVGSAFATSPRVALICLHDPRFSADPGPAEVSVIKIAAFFIEGIDGSGDLIGHLMRIPLPQGRLCSDGSLSAEDAFVWRPCR